MLIYWELGKSLTASNPNYTLITTAINGNYTQHKINRQFYSYKIIDPDPCLVYNFTLNVETDLCSESKTIATHVSGEMYSIST